MDVGTYTSLVTHEHADKPRFMLTLAAPILRRIAFVNNLNEQVKKIDIDTGTGSALDIVGEWVGRSRLSIPNGPTPDDLYRLVLRSKIVGNAWDGSLAKMYEIWNTVFSDKKIIIQEAGLLSILIGLLLKKCTDEEMNVIRDGAIIPKPCGVKALSYMVLKEDAKMFAWGVENEYFGGWGSGHWADEITPKAGA